MEAVTNSSSSCGDRKDAKLLAYQILALSRTLVIRVSHVPCTAERTQQSPSQPPQHPAALFLLGTHPGPGRSHPMGRRWVSSTSHAGDGSSCPGDRGVSGCVKQLLSADICGAGALVLGGLLELFYF